MYEAEPSIVVTIRAEDMGRLSSGGVVTSAHLIREQHVFAGCCYGMKGCRN